MHHELTQLAQFIFQKPSLRRIWKWTALGVALVAIAIVARVLLLHLGFLLPEAFSLFRKSLRVPFVLSGLGIIALFINLAIKWYSQDRRAAKDYLRKHLLESQIPAAGALVIVFLYYLVYVVPHQIRVASIKAPGVASNIPPAPEPPPLRQPTPLGPVVRFPALVQASTPRWTLSQRPSGTLVELQYGNAGPAAANQLRAGANAIFGFDPPTDEMEDKAFSKFVKGIPGTLKPAIDMEPGNKSFIQNLVPELIGKRMEDLLNGREWLLVVGAITYTDPAGRHRKGLCYSLIPPAETHAIPLSENPLMQHWGVCRPKSLKMWEQGASKQ